MTYTNPVIAVKGVDHGDPAVLKYNGMYYLYHTGPRDVPVYKSYDLVHWQPCGSALSASDEPDHWAQIDLWAPEVIHENSVFYMYVTGAMRKEDGSADDEIRHIGVAKSHSPEGPFELAEQPLTDEWSIDAHPFKDEDGTWYLYYNVRNETTRGPGGVIGTGNVVDRMTSLESLSGSPALVVKPEHEWEGNKENSFFWNEGPFVLKKNGTYYQMYSAGFFGDDTYGVYYATSRVPMGSGGMDDTSWKKWGRGKPILKTNEACHGPGHHVVVKGPDGVEDFIVYHGYEPGENLPERRVRLGRLSWEDDHILLEPPVTGELPMPRKPDFDGRFLTDPARINKGLASCAFDDYLFETNVALPGGSCSEAGGCLAYKDENTRLAWALNRQAGTFTVSARKEGNAVYIEEWPLPADFDYEAYHTVRAVVSGEKVSIRIDSIEVAFLSWSTGGKAMVSEDSCADYRGTILTELQR
ncbi:hypothetical protein CR205_02730 [Alteribacter lacisalsi]|uniref:Glycoside hydrolase n=1 Tax=Alteribacter lacisalsi TaxID=2045244 RepID=A0A2W0HKZ3_9BACI|nr:glycoside hydrolase family 43 protein [Alteribacter lacisalsi]PYZ97529.1 hypothetical protein CR205_02730 [Alteribacter lacisalsi]